MGNISNEDLGRTLVDIASNGSNDPEQYQPAQLRHAPTQWDFVQPSYFEDVDFEVIDFLPHTKRWCFNPISKAALYWAWSKLPEGLDRYGKLGFILENRYKTFILHRARQDKLRSREDAELGKQREEWWTQLDQDQEWIERNG